MANPSLDAFFSPQFAQPATLTLLTATPSTREVAVILDIQGAVIGLGAEGRQIIAALPTEQAQGVRHRDTLEVGGKTYEVVGVNPVDDGLITELDLKK